MRKAAVYTNKTINIKSYTLLAYADDIPRSLWLSGYCSIFEKREGISQSHVNVGNRYICEVVNEFINPGSAVNKTIAIT